MTQTEKKPFNPSDHLIQIRNAKGTSDYLEVKWRIYWFRQECPEGTIESELIHLDIDKETEEEVFVWNSEKRRSEKVIKTAKGIAIFRAVVKDGKGGVATGTKMEKASAFPDYLEKAESGSIGRALAALGYGTQFAPELNEEPSGTINPQNTSRSRDNQQNTPNDGKANKEQITKILDFIGKLEEEKPGEKELENLSYADAAKYIQNLATKLNAKIKEQKEAKK